MMAAIFLYLFIKFTTRMILCLNLLFSRIINLKQLWQWEFFLSLAALHCVSTLCAVLSYKYLPSLSLVLKQVWPCHLNSRLTYTCMTVIFLLTVYKTFETCMYFVTNPGFVFLMPCKFASLAGGAHCIFPKLFIVMVSPLGTSGAHSDAHMGTSIRACILH